MKRHKCCYLEFQFDISKWKESHPPSRVRTGLDPLIAHLKQTGVSKIGVTVRHFHTESTWS